MESCGKCRACGEEIAGFSTHLSSSFNGKMKIFEVVNFVAGTKVQPTDSYSKYICTDCQDMLTTAYDIKVKIISTDIKFRQNLNDTGTKSKSKSSPTVTSKVIEVPKSPDKSPKKTEKKAPVEEDDVEVVSDDDTMDPLEKVKVDKPFRFSFDSIVDKINEPVEIPEESFNSQIVSEQSFNSKISAAAEKSHKAKLKAKAEESFKTNLKPKTVKAEKVVPVRKSIPKKVRTVKPKVEIHRCMYCRITFRSKEELQTHNQEVHIDPYRCNDCEVSFTTENAFGVHQTLAHSKKFRCKICSVVLKGQTTYNKHIQSHPTVVKKEIIERSSNQNFNMEIDENPVTVTQKLPGFMTKIPNSSFSEVSPPSTSNSNSEFIVNYDDDQGLLVESDFIMESEIKIEEPWY